MEEDRPLSFFAMFGLATIPFWILGAVMVVIERPQILWIWGGQLLLLPFLFWRFSGKRD